MRMAKSEKRALMNAGAGFFTVLLAVNAAGINDASVLVAAFFGAIAQGGLSYCREMAETYKQDGGKGKLRAYLALSTLF